MSNHKEKFIESLFLYLRKNELDSDIGIYTSEEWIARGEEYLTDSDFVITSEGGLHFILNYGDAGEFYDLVDSFGYIMEMGHSWSYGFYYDHDAVKPTDKKNILYSDKLRDQRWQEKRNIIRERAHYKCQDCNSKNNLEVHHCYYKFGLEPWQYPLDSLRCLCSNCHKKRGMIEMEVRARMADLKSDELAVMSEIIKGGMDYYPEDKVIHLIKILDVDYEKLKEKMRKELDVM